MLKITVRYPDEQELQNFLQLLGGRVIKIKPALDKAARKGENSEFYRREIWLNSR